MKTQSLRLRIVALLAGVALSAFSGGAGADPPSQVARLGYMSGAVSLSPAGDDDWIEAPPNRPLTTGDRLWVDDDARAELQTGGALIRMNGGTSVSVLNLDDRITQLQLTQGSLNVRVRRLARDEVFEVDTPNLAFTLREPGAYRIDVDPDGDATTIVVRQGQGEAYGEDAAYVIDARQAYRFTGTDLRDYEHVAARRPDDFDRWARGRDRGYDDSRSARYVSRDVVGYQDLDEHGSWRVDVTYGNVWTPNRVAAGWAPYHDGHWAWIDPWGWTWVDDAPWGFAVSHYGRWAHLGGTWAWVPGPVRSRAYYAPALVVFLGGGGFQLTISSGVTGGVAWFPLGPREVYRPAYRVSRRYFENINRSNTVINTTVINNYYNNTNVTKVVYVNRNVQSAVVAVPTSTFVQSHPVARSAVRVSRDMIVGAPLALAAPVVPTQKSVRGAAAQGDKPPPRVFERRVVARAAPPAAPVGFAAQRQQLGAKRGQPLDEAERRELKPAASAPAAAVKVIERKQEAPPTVRPPPAPAGVKSDDARARTEQRGKAAQREQRDAAQRERPEAAQRERPDTAQREQPDAAQRERPDTAQPEPQPPRGVVRPRAAPPQASPAAQPRKPRGRAEPGRDDEPRGGPAPRGNAEQRGQTASPPPASTPHAAERELAPRQATPKVPAVKAPEPREKSELRDEREVLRARQPGERTAAQPGAPARMPAADRAREVNKDREGRKLEDEQHEAQKGREARSQ